MAKSPKTVAFKDGLRVKFLCATERLHDLVYTGSEFNAWHLKVKVRVRVKVKVRVKVMVRVVVMVWVGVRVRVRVRVMVRVRV